MGKILIIDDDANTTKLLEFILSKEGYEVISVNNSDESLSTAVAHHPNLVLLDLMMPDMDGLEVCRNLRTETQFAQVPIVFFTSAGDIHEKVAAFDSGANDYILKPVHPQELKLRIKALISNGQNGNHG